MRLTLNNIISRLQENFSPDEARDLAFWIIEETLGFSRVEVLTSSEERIIPNLDSILTRLLNHEPIQYIFGHTLWNGLDLLVNPSTLIPRPETAEIIHILDSTFTEDSPRSVLPLKREERLPPRREFTEDSPKTHRRTVLDIGTGSGCIALALKNAHPDFEVYALDFSEDALATAKQNALRNHLDVTFHHLDILDDAACRDFISTSAAREKHGDTLVTRGANGYFAFDIIVSNPPYVLDSEATSMEQNVLDFEPHSALFVPDSDPLLFYRRIASLKWAPYLVFEINERFGCETAQMLESLGYTHVHIHHDQYGKDRFVTAQLSPENLSFS